MKKIVGAEDNNFLRNSMLRSYPGCKNHFHEMCIDGWRSGRLKKLSLPTLNLPGKFE